MNLLAQANPWSGIDIGADLLTFSPLIALVCTMLAVVACPILFGRRPQMIAGVVVIGLITTFFFALKVGGIVSGGGVSGLSTEPGGGLLIADNLTVGFQIVLVVFMAGVMWLWWMRSGESERNAPEFFVLMLGSALGMALMTSSLNLLMIVLAIEMASLPSYALVGFDKQSRAGAEASLKYMIFGAISAAIMLYGVSLIYGLVGSLNVADMARYTFAQISHGENRIVLAVALLCFFVGLAFKISAVPFHFWCPDAFEGAKIEVTTWLSVVSKAAGLILLARIVMTICAAADSAVAMSFLSPVAWTIGIVAAITCTYGNFAAYKQESVKRLLAYSSIAHAGYMLMAVAVFVHPSSRGHGAAIAALFTYIVIYLFMNLGAFGVTALVAGETGSDRIDAFTGLIRRAPLLAIPMILCLISLVGIPPLAGFIGKWWVLVALGSMEESGHSTFKLLGWSLVVVACFNTLTSLFYYMRIVVQMVLKDDGREAIHGPLAGRALVNVCALMLLAMFVFAGPLKGMADHFAGNLYVATVDASASSDGDIASARTESR